MVEISILVLIGLSPTIKEKPTVQKNRKPEKKMAFRSRITRRALLTSIAGASGLALTSCSTTPQKVVISPLPRTDPYFATLYGPIPDEKFPIPAINLNHFDERYYRRQIEDPTGEMPGTIVVDTRSFYLYLVQQNGLAMRYGVGLGRAGFEWSGRAHVRWKKAWPKWTPPADMIKRQPELSKWSATNGGMPPGLDNPLGARALYIFQGNKDTLYRLHGTAEIESIGKAVSSGCVRLVNHDIIDLYNRVPNNSPILVV